MVMDWKSFSAFLAVARSASIPAGAEQREGIHATIRRHVEGLEAQLFPRNASGLTLKAAGQGAGMMFVANWVQTVFPEMQRLPGTDLDKRRST